ncbi:cathepsin B-like [Planococcus citri]|uniref:cathepsin B-like n=1 Tax=Planococcus citri TaxID=170843 RepID=UPI0031F8CED4
MSNSPVLIPGLSWRAGSNGLGKSIKLSQIKRKLGWIPKQKEISHGDPHPTGAPTDEKDDLPKNYDCRKAFPKCTTIPSIKDQSNCGSCWAVSVAATFSDRLCIHSNGKVNFNMSADQLLACDKKSDGCDGGYLDTAWQYIEKEGLVTGGDYGSNELAQVISKIIPSISPSGFHLLHNEYFSFPKCVSRTDHTHIFLHSFLGIYQRPFFDFIPLGGHAVRVIGWGEEDGMKYWLVANSWGTDWGEEGTFRIIRGTNECSFESEAVTALPEN